MSRLLLLSLIALPACAPPEEAYSSLCEDSTGTENQVSCLEDATSQARSDVDASQESVLSRVREPATRRELIARAEAARDAISDRLDRARDRIRRDRRDEDRRRDLRDGLVDIGREVDRCDRDLRDLRDRSGDDRPDEGDGADRPDRGDDGRS